MSMAQFLGPQKTLSESTQINPDLTAWKKQDKLIIAWLFITITEPVMALVLHLKTSREIW